MVQHQLPGAEFGDEEDPIPVTYRTLFPEGQANLTKITETPAKMILPLVRMRIIDEAYNPKRKVSLLQTFINEFDDRMISKDRKGRIEAVQMLAGMLSRDEDEEEAAM